jgi:hypothetical protein
MNYRKQKEGEKSRILSNRDCRPSLSPEGTGICGGADLGRRRTTAAGKGTGGGG